MITPYPTPGPTESRYLVCRAEAAAVLTLHGGMTASDFGAEEKAAFASAIASSVSYCTDAREVIVKKVSDHFGFDDDGDDGDDDGGDDQSNATSGSDAARARRLRAPPRQFHHPQQRTSWPRRAAGAVAAAAHAAWNAFAPCVLAWPTADDDAAVAPLRHGRALAATQDVHVNYTLEISLESAGYTGLATDFSAALLAEVRKNGGGASRSRLFPLFTTKKPRSNGRTALAEVTRAFTGHRSLNDSFVYHLSYHAVGELAYALINTTVNQNETLASLERIWYAEVYESDVVVFEEASDDIGYLALTVPEVREITATASIAIAVAVAASVASAVGAGIGGSFASAAAGEAAAASGSSAAQAGDGDVMSLIFSVQSITYVSQLDFPADDAFRAVSSDDVPYYKDCFP